MTILQKYFQQNRDEVLDNLLAFVCDIRPEIHENYRINGQGRKEQLCVRIGILDAFMEYEASAKLEQLHPCEKALSYFCILCSRSRHFWRITSLAALYKRRAYPKIFSFYLICLRNLLCMRCRFSSALQLKQHIYQYFFFLRCSKKKKQKTRTKHIV